MSEQSARRALHQRSDSESNSQKYNSGEGSIVSTKAYTVSIWSSGANSTQEQKTSKHKRTGTDSSNGGSTNTASRSNTIKSSKSAGSLYSLPPVPPLRIYKDRDSVPGAVGTENAQTATTGYTMAQVTPAMNYGPSNFSSDIPSPPVSGGGPPAPLRPLPRSILKQPSSESAFADYEDSEFEYRLPTPPHTSASDEYRRKSSLWVGASTQQDATPNRAYMNAQSLRIVGTNDGASFTTEDSMGDSVAPGGLGVRGGVRPESRRIRRVSETESMEEKARVAQGLPTWTSYFYGRGNARTSHGEPAIPQSRLDEEMDPNAIGQAITSLTPSPSPRLHPRISPDVIDIPPRGINQSPEPDATTLWSTPHLDRATFTRLEAMNGNRQVILFCLGFILPICWFIAAFLPLPQPPTTRKFHDVEANLAQDLYTTRTTQMYLEKRWINSRFWRRVNRILSCVGAAIIIAVVVVAAVTAAKGA